MPWWVLALRLTGIGWYIAASIVGGIMLGWWIDGKLGTSPLLLLIGLLLGTVVAFYGTYRLVQPFLGDLRPPNSPAGKDKPR
jgi:F0F1-type ATP synthase assembly protein I